MLDAMYALLARMGFTDPLHAPITHMPIGLITGSLVFFVTAIIFKRRQLITSARHASILALLFVFPTILFGVFDWIHFYHAVLFPAIKIKMVLAGTVLLLLGAGIILGSEVKIRAFWMTAIYALAFVAVVGLGWFGAGIIYGRGIAVTAETKAVVAAAPGAPAEATAPGAPSSGGDLNAGQATFNANCQGCHPSGGNIIVPLLPIKGSKQLKTLEAFTAFIRNPTMPNGGAGEMPPFGTDQVSDAKAKDLYAYVTTTWK
ncbi:MAG TPA: c-type cytochrome [Rectinemataceae bacterium]|nr:c-type cytochrome [Rectinemataceae bacterium]